MKKIIIAGHGNFGSGLMSSLDLLAGANQDIIAVDFLGDMSEDDLKNQMEDIITQFLDEEILFVCDILGGTPFKTAATLANSAERIEVVAGCNLGSILEVLFQKDNLTLGELADTIITSSKQYTVRFEKKVDSVIHTFGTEMEEGI